MTSMTNRGRPMRHGQFELDARAAVGSAATFGGRPERGRRPLGRKRTKRLGNRSAFSRDGQAVDRFTAPTRVDQRLAPGPTTWSAAMHSRRVRAEDVQLSRRINEPRQTAGRTARRDRRRRRKRLVRGSGPAARSASEDIPFSSQSQAIASPCAAAIPTRMPVKLPDRHRPGCGRPAGLRAFVEHGHSLSAWPRPIAHRDARDRPRRCRRALRCTRQSKCRWQDHVDSTGSECVHRNRQAASG